MIICIFIIILLCILHIFYRYHILDHFLTSHFKQGCTQSTKAFAVISSRHTQMILLAWQNLSEKIRKYKKIHKPEMKDTKFFLFSQLVFKIQYLNSLIIKKKVTCVMLFLFTTWYRYQMYIHIHTYAYKCINIYICIYIYTYYIYIIYTYIHIYRYKYIYIYI